VHYLNSASVGQEFKLLVGTVGPIEDTPQVVLYVPDADWYFGGVMNILLGLRWAGYVPHMLVVGIGYRVQSEVETLPLRRRDLTPSGQDNEFQHLGWASGGAEKFLQFIRTELKPWVAKQFSVDADENVFFGDSLGGLFGTYVLLTQPDTFKRYGLGSPSLWYNDKSTFDLEVAYAEVHNDLEAKVYFSVGALENLEGEKLHRGWLPEDKRAEADAKAEAEVERIGEINMVADMQRMVSALSSRNYARLALGSEVLPDEFHLTAPLLNFSRCMRFLFDAPRRGE
jgi:predicted alpha/beta superfamily hydrolase